MSRLRKQMLCFHTQMLALLVFAFSLPVQGGEFKQGILWEISKPGLAASYLLGTIHSGDPRVIRLPSPVSQAFANSRSFTGEMDMSMESLEQTQKDLLLPNEKTLDTLIGETRYNYCVALMSDYDVPESLVKKMKPWAIAVQLNMPKPESDRFLDLMLYQQAIARGMPVHALETGAEQIEVFDKLSLEQQIVLLDEAMYNYEEMPALIEKLINLYLARDLAGMHSTSNDQMQKGDSGLASKVEQRLIIERNYRMAKRMQQRLQEGRAFIAVGALHLSGKEGILNLLEKQGYQIKVLY